MRIRFVVLVFLFAAVAQAQTAGVGEVHFANSGAAAAQESFLTGLALLHNFEYEDAAQAFQKAEKTDPNFAMAYWGEAMTYTHPIWMEQDRDAAVAVLQRFGSTPQARLEKVRTRREKDYWHALEILYGSGEKNDRDFAYADAMQALHRKYPDDPDAAAFYALSLLGTAHEGRDTRIYMKAAAILEDVFHDHPNHPGAAHYLIHCYDDPIHAPLGMRAARAYSKIAPSAGHAQHMTSHIFIALGMWNEVVAANEVATGIENTKAKQKGMPVSFCGHYNFWLLYGYLQQHRFEDAKRILEGCRAQALAPVKDSADTGMKGMYGHDRALASFISMRTRYLLDTEEWKGETAGWTLPEGSTPAAAMTFEFANAFGAIRRDEMDSARQALDRFKKSRAEWQEQKSQDASDLQRADILEQELTAMLMAADGKKEPAVELLRKSATTEDGMAFAFGPPAVDKPADELLGEILLEMNQPKEAVTAFKHALERAPERAASLQGLALASAK